MRLVRRSIVPRHVLAAAAAAAGLAVIAPAFGAQSPADVEQRTIQYESGSAMVEAYVARPTAPGRHPAVIVVHDNLGLNGRFRELATQLARAGFVTIAPHFPSRAKTPASEPPDGRPQPVPVARVPWNQSIADVQSAFTYLQQDSGVDAGRISAIGVGWGEYRVWKLAEATPALHRAVVFYGVTPTDDDRLQTIRTPVLGHYAELDYLITARVLRTKQLLGNRFTYHIYPTVPGFFGGGTGQIQPATGGSVISLPSGSHQASAATAAKLAWTRTLAFLKGA
jgi:carboxymethylenebutenolidase